MARLLQKAQWRRRRRVMGRAWNLSSSRGFSSKVGELSGAHLRRVLRALGGRRTRGEGCSVPGVAGDLGSLYLLYRYIFKYVIKLRQPPPHATNGEHETFTNSDPIRMTDLTLNGGGHTLRMGDAAPDFEARSTRGPVSLAAFRGRWVVFFSHPADFTPVCTTEFVALAKAYDRFQALNCELLGLSVDSLYSHLAWRRAIHELFGVEIPFPVVEDPSMAIGRAYGMITEDATNSSGLRASYFIDPEGVIRAITHYPLTIGRSVDEMVRMVAALQATHSGERLAPADWEPRQPLLLPADEKAQSTPDWFCRREA